MKIRKGNEWEQIINSKGKRSNTTEADERRSREQTIKAGKEIGKKRTKSV